MHPEDKMTFSEIRKYLRLMQKRYKLASNRRERSKLLNEMQAITGFHRKYLIRLVNSPTINITRKPRAKERGPKYNSEVRYVVAIAAKALDYPSAERLKPQLVPVAKLLASHNELSLNQEVLDKLYQISISTLKRILATISRDKPRPPSKRASPKSSLLKDIPAGSIPWDVKEPGHFEVDLVHHCGPTASGEYICTIQMVDVATGWVELWAVLGRGYKVMQDAFLHILHRLPFPIREIHPDNGSEFFNHHLLRFWKSFPDVRLSRSRPYRKNDNRFVEQRNHFLVRSYIGYDRLDTVAQTILLNTIYQKMWIYHNLFLPVMRTVEKVVVPSPSGGYKVKRVYDQAQTPLQRLEKSGVVNPQRLELLKRLRDQTNPLRLREEIYELIEELYSLPNATPGVSEDVYETLGLPIDLPAGLLGSVTLSFEPQPHQGNIII